MQVKDIMTRAVETVAPDDSIRDAARKMEAWNIGFLPVWREGALVGVITDRDITVRAVAKGCDPEQTTVEEAMTDIIVVLPENSELEDASDLMEDKHVRRLVVTDENDNPVGVISMDKVAAYIGRYGMAGETTRRAGSHDDPGGDDSSEFSDFQPGVSGVADADICLGEGVDEAAHGPARDESDMHPPQNLEQDTRRGKPDRRRRVTG